MNQPVLDNKIRFPRDPNQPAQVVTITEITTDGAVARINNLPAHSVSLDASVIGDQALQVGDVLTVWATKPAHFGFRGALRMWTATEILDTKGSQS